MDNITAQMLLKLNGTPLICTCGKEVSIGKIVEVYKNYILLEAIHPDVINNTYVVTDLKTGRVTKSFPIMGELINVLLCWESFKRRQNDLL